MGRIENVTKRPYEISVWTLQDDFITTLKSVNSEFKGQLYNAHLNVKDDGTQLLTFDIPMKYFDEEQNEKLDNPLWFNVKNGVLITNVRKIKVILNKNLIDEKIYEFLITSIIEKREKKQLICTVKAEGLAFHDLGKIGYEIELNIDTFEVEYVKDLNLVASINYWLDKVFPKDDSGNWSTSWGYDIQMNWADYDGILEQDRYSITSPDIRKANKIYEDQHVTSWTVNAAQILVPNGISELQEKYRFIDVINSNKYNITQDIAEAFGVFCRYEYTYDKSNKIVSKTAVFYNKAIEDQTPLDITYEKNLEGLSRTIDSVNLITKLYVTDIESDSSVSGLVSIAETMANPTLERYILNFDYLYRTGAINQYQYNEVPKFEAAMRNTQLLAAEAGESVSNLSVQENELKIAIKNSEFSFSSAVENITKYQIFIDNDTIGTVQRLANNPISTVFLDDQNANTYTASLSYEGINASTVNIYTDYKCQSNSLIWSYSGTKLLTICFVLDEDGFIKGISTPKSSFNAGSPLANTKKVYLTFSYTPVNKYLSVINRFQMVRDQESALIIVNTAKLGLLETQLEDAKTNLKTVLTKRSNLVETFDKMMGMALREGVWQTDNYSDPGEHFQDIVRNRTSESSHGLLKFFFDEIPFDGEQKNYYEIGSNSNPLVVKNYYTCIPIDSAHLPNITGYEDSLFLTVRKIKNDNSERNIELYLNSGFKYTFLKQGTTITPAILITNEEVFLADYKSISYYVSINAVQSNISSIFGISAPITSQPYTIVYPRLTIDSLNVNTTSSALFISYSSIINPTEFDLTNLEIFYDYSVLTRLGYPFINLKVTKKNSLDVIMNNYYTVDYQISRANEMLYLDALEVARDSAYPQTSYDVVMAMLPGEWNLTEYNIGRLVYINDYEMYFKKVQGYVSEFDLDLEQMQNDKFTIKNYKTRFEDLFGRIVASSEQMKMKSVSYDRAASAFTGSGEIKGSVLQQSINNNNIAFDFSASGVTIDNAGGIVVVNSRPYMNGVYGVVAIRGGGIFCADTVDDAGNYVWHTGVTPSGINASLVTAGQIDTNVVRIFSGENMRFNWNSEGLFAYGFDAANVATDLEKWVRYNDQGLIFSTDNGATSVVELGWNGLIINSEDGSLKINPTDGVQISGQNGAVKLTAQSGLQIYDRSSPPKMRVWLGEFATNDYGLNIYDLKGQSVLRTHVENDLANLWLNGELAIGPYSVNPIVGITGAINPILTEQQIIDGNLVPQDQTLLQYEENISKRFYSGGLITVQYEGNNIDIPQFTVLHDGTVFANKAYIRGEVIAETGTFTGTIFATSGEFTGIINAAGGTINGDLNVVTGGVFVGNRTSGMGVIKFENSTDTATLWAGGTVNGNEELVSAPFYYSPERGLSITGNINVTSGNIQDHLYVNNGQAGMAALNAPTVDGQDKGVVIWTGADTTPTLNIDTSHSSYFFSTNAGELYAKGVYVDGDISIRSGQVNGFLEIYNSLNPTVKTIISNDINSNMLSVTKTDGNTVNVPFYITQEGNVYAQNLTLDGKLNVVGNSYLTGSLYIDNTSSVQSKNFVSGTRGWYIGNVDGVDYAEFTNVKIRGELTSSIFKYDTVSAIGGELWVRPAIILSSDTTINAQGIATVTSSASSLKGFTSGQSVYVQSIVKLKGQNTYAYPNFTAQINSINGDILYLSIPDALDVNIDKEDIDFLCAGTSVISEVNSANDIGIKLSAIDAFGPYIDVYDQSNPLVRLGNLRGITDPLFGTLQGYGLYASDAYITGKLYLPNAGITNAGNTDDSIRIWAGTPPEDMETAPFRVYHDGSLFASRGVFSGTIEAGAGSVFNGAIELAGIVLDKQDATDKFFVSYTGTPKNDDDYVLFIDKTGLNIFEGGLHIYSDYADGWRGDVKYNDQSYKVVPYGGINNRYPYVTVNDTGMRLVAKRGHYLDIAQDYTYNSIKISNGTIQFATGTASASANFLEAENSAFNSNNVGYLQVNENRIELAGENVHIGNSVNNITFEDEITIVGDINNSQSEKSQFNNFLIKKETVQLDTGTKNVVAFYYVK